MYLDLRGNGGRSEFDVSVKCCIWGGGEYGILYKVITSKPMFQRERIHHNTPTHKQLDAVLFKLFHAFSFYLSIRIDSKGTT